MKISIEVNESEIIKNVLAGIDQKQIEKMLIDRLKATIVNDLERGVRESFAEKYKSKIVSFEDTISELVNKQVKRISKEAVKSFLDDADEDSVGEALGEYIETWLTNNEISFQFINNCGKKPHKCDSN